MARARGWEGDADGLLGNVMGDTRRATSVTVVKAKAMCLLERLAHLGPVLMCHPKCILPLNSLSHSLHCSLKAPCTARMWSAMCELLLILGSVTLLVELT